MTRSESSNSSDPSRSYSASTPSERGVEAGRAALSCGAAGSLGSTTGGGAEKGTTTYVVQAGSSAASCGPSRSTRPRRGSPLAATDPSSPTPSGMVRVAGPSSGLRRVTAKPLAWLGAGSAPSAASCSAEAVGSARRRVGPPAPGGCRPALRRSGR